MLSRIIKRNMSQNVVKIINNAEIAEKRLAELRNKLEEVKKLKVNERVKELTEENKVLATKVQSNKSELIRLEILNGKKQYAIPGKDCTVMNSVAVQDATHTVEQQLAFKETTKKKTTEKLSTEVQESLVDIRKLDLRIGKILDINKHPDADSLYVEKIDCGEDSPRTVVSGLVNHVPIDEMRDRIVMVLCNLKPVKMRGVTSEAMVMCASSPEKVEVLVPPNGAVPGDLVSCEGYPREPEPQLNPKKKIFETCALDLMTNDDKVACYKGRALVVPGKGPVIASTLKGVYVK